MLAHDVVLLGRVLDERFPDAPRASEVLLVCRDRYCFTVGLLAAARRGWIVALPPNAQPEAVRALRSQAHVVTVLHDADETFGIDVSELVGRTEDEAPLDVIVTPPASETMCFVYTSGSTGAPTRHAKTFGQLVGEASVLASEFLPDVASPRVVATVPPHHIYGLLFGVLLPLVSGGSFARGTPLAIDEIERDLLTLGADVLVSVPAHLRALTSLETLPSLGRVFSSGAPLPLEAAGLLFTRFGWSVLEVLGSTETGGMASREPAFTSRYRALPGITIDEAEDGRMLVRSPFVPGSSELAYRGGDAIRAHDDGTFEHLGRLDGVVKIGGTRIAVREVELLLLGLPHVVDAAVIVEDVEGLRGKELWAVVATAHPYDPASVRAALAAWLDPVVMPRRYRFVTSLPREDNGKLRRDVLVDLFATKKR